MEHHSYAGKTVLVTGGAGAIGSCLTNKLMECGASVVILDDFSSGYEFNIPSEIEIVRGDISSRAVVAEALDYEPSHVFHLAAFFANQNSVDHPHADLETNGHGTISLLQECAQSSSVERIVYASSSCVYDESEELPYTESESVQITFNTPYEITKTLGEAYCNYFQTTTNLDVVRARVFNSYGPGEVPGEYRNVIPNFVYFAMQDEPLPITGSGKETRDFTYVDDVVRGLLRLGSPRSVSGEVYNLATGKETTIDELARIINDRTNNEAGVEYKSRREWDETDRRRGSIQKSSEAFGFEPRVRLESGIDKTASWFENNWESIKQQAEF